MTSNISKMQILSIYKLLMRESQKFSSYNFRAYALRRIRDGFKSNKTLTEAKQIKTAYENAQKDLGIIKRQVVIGSMYSTEKLVIENLQQRTGEKTA